MDKGKTHFGYQSVDASEKAGLVGRVFGSVAGRYDLMNDLMSFGVHRLWKRYAVELAAVRPGQRILDLAGGTGDLAHLVSKDLKGQGEVVVADINQHMLKLGRRRMIDAGQFKCLSFVRCDAELLPFLDDSFDCVIVGFGLRNMTNKQLALKTMYRVLKPGGRVIILEFSKVKPWLEPCYRAWSFAVIPHLGRLFAGDRDSYQYLVESIQVHPDQETLLGFMRKAGFERCQYFNLTQGICAVHKGYKL